MNDRGPIDIDMAIDSALRGERFRRAPFTLRRRVEERVRIVALRESEQHRFRCSMAVLAIGFLGALVLVAGAVLSSNPEVLVRHSMAGGKGQYDYLTTSVALFGTDYRGSYSLLWSLLAAAGTLLLGLIPLRGHRSSHWKSANQ